MVFPLHCTDPSFESPHPTVFRPSWHLKFKSKRGLLFSDMGISRNWFRKLRRNITILHTPTLTASHQQITNRDSTATEQSLLPQHHRLSSSSPQNKLLTQRDIAAIKIQAIFRGHLVFHLPLLSIAYNLIRATNFTLFLWINRQDGHLEHSRAWSNCKHWSAGYVWGGKHVLPFIVCMHLSGSRSEFVLGNSLVRVLKTYPSNLDYYFIVSPSPPSNTCLLL